MNHRRPRNQPAKVVDPAPRDVVLRALSLVSQVVGSTLGPGGRPALLERQEPGMPPFLSKDGVTVFRAIGLEDPRMDAVVELTRDAAVRTATAAGDGTTSATVLAAALVERVDAYCRDNPRESPQRVARQLAELIEKQGLDFLQAQAVSASFTTPDGKDDPAGTALLRAVARVSANGDDALADAAVRACKLAGDFGMVALGEASGPTEYRVQRVSGYTLPVGYEDSCKSLWYAWVNDPVAQRVVLERPRFLLVNGRVHKLQAIREPLERLSDAWNLVQAGDAAGLAELLVAQGVLAGPRVPVPGKAVLEQLDAENRATLDEVMRTFTPAVVVVATGFSDDALSVAMQNFVAEDGLKIFPLLAPQGPAQAYQQQVLLDLAAVTGASVFDPVGKPTGTAKLSDLGPGVVAFECHRTTSAVVGQARETAPSQRQRDLYTQRLAGRVADVAKQAREVAVSKLDSGLATERMAKLSGGLAKLTVVGNSNGEIRERRDRAEDAVCAVRGAVRAGCLPGAGWAHFALGRHLADVVREDAELAKVVDAVLLPALEQPLRRLVSNAGFPKDEEQGVVDLYKSNAQRGNRRVYDLIGRGFVDALEAGLLDSAPAVLESVRAAAAIALQLGTLGSIVAYKRDDQLEREEAREALGYQRDAGNAADERA